MVGLFISRVPNHQRLWCIHQNTGKREHSITTEATTPIAVVKAGEKKTQGAHTKYSARLTYGRNIEKYTPKTNSNHNHKPNGRQ